MKTAVLVQHYNQLLVQRNRLLMALLVIGLLCVLLALSIFCLIGKERTIIVPPAFNREFWVGADTVSDSYLEQMSQYFASLLLNVTPNTFSVNAEHLLQHVATENFAAVKTQLVEQQQEMERKALSTTFHITSFRIDRLKLLVELKGELKVLVANAPLVSKTKTYQIQFVHRNGRLYIQTFNEIEENHA